MKKRVLLSLTLAAFSLNVFAFSEPCQLVAQMAGNQEYEQKPLRMASMVKPELIPGGWHLQFLESHGAWFIYQSEQAWIGKEQCAPLQKQIDGKTIEFMPVLLNKQSGHNAVITGTFIIRVYRKQHLQKVMQQYGFKMLSPLPNPRSVIVDVKPTASYDLLIRDLDKDKNIELALPLLSEPRLRK